MFATTTSRDIPVENAKLDVHPHVRSKVEAANRATQAAALAAIASRDPMASATFGTKRQNIETVANARKSVLNTIFMTGVPTFALRPSEESFKGLLGVKRDTDACLRLVMANLADPLSVKFPIQSAESSVASATSIFTSLADVRDKVTHANRAVHEAVVAMLEYRERIAPVVFGAQMQFLELFANASEGVLESVLSCGVALFSLRMANENFATVLGPKDDVNACFQLLQETFALPLSITSL